MWKSTIAASALCLAGVSTIAAETCAEGKTLQDGVLTIATGNPAYYPWVIDDAPESGKGFEAAVAYAVAAEMGFANNAVVWTRTSFDQAIQPGQKDFDLNLQQFSITEARDKVVDFSAPYYTAPMAVLVRGGAALTPDLATLKKLKWGVVATTTALPVVLETIDPDSSPLIYDDTANVAEAMKANQIDAGLFDLPTALYMSVAVLEGGQVLGQFAPDETDNPDHFGMILAEGNPLKDCVDAALKALKSNGTLDAIEAQWLLDATGVPRIE
ncbi:MAG: ABC transporter substrate-binding protein [Roseobacter sp.]